MNKNNSKSDEITDIALLTEIIAKYIPVDFDKVKTLIISNYCPILI